MTSTSRVETSVSNSRSRSRTTVSAKISSIASRNQKWPTGTMCIISGEASPCALTPGVAICMSPKSVPKVSRGSSRRRSLPAANVCQRGPIGRMA